MFRNHSCVKLWLVGFTLMTGCRHASVNRDVAGAPPPGEEILVDEGDSAQPSYSADGKFLLFVSAQRPLHKSSQVYVKDLRTNVERRVTFQNGTVSRPRFHPRGDQIIYSSTTDEDKEIPAFLRENGPSAALPAWLRQPTEIYVHGLDSYDIERVVTHAGFDGEASFIRNGRSITWTQVTRDRAAILSSNRVSHQTIALKNLGSNPTGYVLANDLQTAAWVSYDDAYAGAHLMLRRDGKVSELGAERKTAKLDLSFSADAKWLTWAEFDPATQTYLLYAHEFATRCAREIGFATPGSRRDPVISPDGTQIAYTWLGFDRSRVARARFAPRACP